MIGSSLYNAVNGLSIGNGTVYNFVDYIGEMHLTGGIQKYTAARGYYNFNMSNNHGGGTEGRYGYGDDLTGDENAREKIYGTDGRYLMNGNLYQAYTPSDKIGDYYGVYDLTNSKRKFLSIDEFSLMGDILRNENLSDNVEPQAFENRYGDEGAGKFNAVGVDRYDVGSEYKIEFAKIEDFKKKTIERKQLSENNLANKYLNLQIKNEIVSKSDKTSSKGIPVYEYGSPVSISDDLGEVTSRVKNILRVGEFGLIDFDSEYGEKNMLNKYNQMAYIRKSRGLGSTIPKYDGGTKFFNNHPYGVSNVYDGIVYEVPDAGREFDKKRFSPSDHKMSPTDKAGSMRTSVMGRKKDAKNSAIYEYYQEFDNGSVKTRVKSSNETSDGFTAKIGFGSGNYSQILRATNNVFRSDEAKSLINRFHTTKTDFSDDELVSSYSRFGLSRGRNLLRKNGQADTSTGFHNPYCRVWTAHHQYSTMKDRIRPFMDGGNFKSIADTQKDLGALRPNGANRLSDNSVLMDSGFVRVSPHNTMFNTGYDSLKKYMFSIENLAWKDFARDEFLYPEQRGMYGGRIMWFPPYNLKFTENVNTSWRDNEFIGRGEKIYTYANTERGGTLSFTLLIDHPSILNKWRGTKDINGSAKEEMEQDILRYFAGCGELDPSIGRGGIKKDDIDSQEDEDLTPKPKPDAQYIDFKYVMFFPNNFSANSYRKKPKEAIDKINQYEMTNGVDPFTEMDKKYKDQILSPENYFNNSIYGLNTAQGLRDNIKDIDKMLNVGTDPDHVFSYEELRDDLQEKFGGDNIFGLDSKNYEIGEIVIDGYASDAGYIKYNKILAEDRAKLIAAIAGYVCKSVDTSKIKKGKYLELTVGRAGGNKDDVDDKFAKIARSSVITFRVKLKDNIKPEGADGNKDVVAKPIILGAPIEPIGNIRASIYNAQSGLELEGVPKENTEDIAPGGDIEKDPENIVTVTTVKKTEQKNEYTYGNEYLYFKKISAEDKMVYKSIVDKVRFFEPAFHSLTPEGFNARLNFLHQCTRQGPTIGSHSGNKTDEMGGASDYRGSAANLAFGRPPYCILRIGDFYFSKICIQSISINYDNNGGTQWDLNQEGIGVQPMMANIDINFMFIGGQDIDGPVNSLQNAITNNYYANSSIYDDGNWYSNKLGENKQSQSRG